MVRPSHLRVCALFVLTYIVSACNVISTSGGCDVTGCDVTSSTAITIQTPVSGSYINDTNGLNLSVQGTCKGVTSITVAVGGIQALATCGTTGTFSTTLGSLVGLAAGSYTLTASSGSTSSSVTLIRSSTTLVAPSFVPYPNNPVGGINYVTTSTAGFSVTADPASVQMSFFNSGDCTGNPAWTSVASPYYRPIYAPNAVNTFSLMTRARDGSLSPCSTAVSVTSDMVSPILTIDGYDPHNPMYTSLSAIDISGTCTQNGSAYNGTVSLMVNGAAYPVGSPMTTTCSPTGDGGSPGYTLSAIPFTTDGTYSVTVQTTDPAGNVGTTPTLTLIRETTPPTGTSLSINNGALTTNTVNVTLYLAATGATQMWITKSSDCSGGTWIDYASTYAFALDNVGSGNTASVYAKFRNGALVETTPCLSASITEQFNGPAVSINSPIGNANGYVGLSNEASVPISGTCNLPGSTVNVTIASGGQNVTATPTCTQSGATFVWSTTVNIAGISDGAFTADATLSDGVTTAHATTVNFNKDTVAPILYAFTNLNNVTTTPDLSTVVFQVHAADSMAGATLSVIIGSSCDTSYTQQIGVANAGDPLVWNNGGLPTNYYRFNFATSTYPTLMASNENIGLMIVDQAGNVSSCIQIPPVTLQ